MHSFRAVEVEDPEDNGRIGLRWDAHQRQTCNRPDIHRDDARLFFIFGVETFNHKNCRAALDHIVNNRVARLEMGLRERALFRVHTRRVSKAAASPHEYESPLRAADLERRLEDLLKSGIRREQALPLILKIQDAGNLFQGGHFRWKYVTQIHQGPLE